MIDLLLLTFDDRSLVDDDRSLFTYFVDIGDVLKADQNAKPDT